MSTTKIARSATLPPRFLKDANEACPGESITSNPGIIILTLNFSSKLPHVLLITSTGILVAPMCCVICPGSVVATVVPLILSSSVV